MQKLNIPLVSTKVLYAVTIINYILYTQQLLSFILWWLTGKVLGLLHMLRYQIGLGFSSNKLSYDNMLAYSVKDGLPSSILHRLFYTRA